MDWPRSKRLKGSPKDAQTWRVRAEQLQKAAAGARDPAAKQGLEAAAETYRTMANSVEGQFPRAKPRAE